MRSASQQHREVGAAPENEDDQGVDEEDRDGPGGLGMRFFHGRLFPPTRRQPYFYAYNRAGLSEKSNGKRSKVKVKRQKEEEEEDEGKTRYGRAGVRKMKRKVACSLFNVQTDRGQ